MNKKVSIIVPVYNCEKYIENCLLSVMNQTYKNLEIILIDDGSKDSSGDICDKYEKKDSRIIVFHIKNGGVSNARNYGLKMATGAYIQFVDSDDMIENNMTEICVRKMEDEDADLVVCSFKRITKYVERKEPYIDKEITYEASKYLENILKDPTGYYYGVVMVKHFCNTWYGYFKNYFVPQMELVLRYKYVV